MTAATDCRRDLTEQKRCKILNRHLSSGMHPGWITCRAGCYPEQREVLSVV